MKKDEITTTLLRKDSYADKIPFTSYIISELLTSLRIRIYDLGQIEVTPKFWPGDNLHVDPYTRIYYFTEGEAQFTCNGKEFAIKPHRFYLFPAQTEVSFYCRKAFHYLMHCRLSVWGEVDFWHIVKGGGVELRDFPPSLVKRFKTMCRFHPKSPAGQLELLALSYEFLSRFWAEGKWKIRDCNWTHIRRVQKAVDVAKASLPHRITVDTMAKAACLSRSAFSVEFKKYIGISPARYLMEQRLEQAQCMLLESDMTIESIADKLGFSSAFHLSRAFKKRYSISPRQFRTSSNTVIRAD